MQAKLKCGLLLVLCAGAASAQIYRWKDANGVTHFSDTPPASVPATKIEVPASTEATPALPFELALAIKNHPVTLYTTAQCAACDQGRALLQARGVPYTEKTVSNASDHAALRQVGGASQLPLLLVGRNKFIGYEQVTWDAALTAASYPMQSILPSGYRQPAPKPAAPLPIDAVPRTGDDDGKARLLPSPMGPSNFQF
jgi:glutaredoxin